MVRSGGGGLALHSLRRVFESLTPNAKDIYLLIVKYQMEAVEEQGFAFYQGFSFKDLYRYQCDITIPPRSEYWKLPPAGNPTGFPKGGNANMYSRKKGVW